MLLRKLVDRGHAILCTVHQPSAQLFALFDKVLLLKDGQTAYFGETGPRAATLRNYFETRGARTCSSEENAAEWMIETVQHSPTAKHPPSETAQSTSWGDVWRNSHECDRVKQQLSEIQAPDDDDSDDELTANKRYGASFAQQFIMLTQRILRDQWRTPIYLYTKFAASFGLVSHHTPDSHGALD